MVWPRWWWRDLVSLFVRSYWWLPEVVGLTALQWLDHMIIYRRRLCYCHHKYYSMDITTVPSSQGCFYIIHRHHFHIHYHIQFLGSGSSVFDSSGVFDPHPSCCWSQSHTWKIPLKLPPCCALGANPKLPRRWTNWKFFCARLEWATKNPAEQMMAWWFHESMSMGSG